MSSDALGMKIKIGDWYAHSSRSSGFSSVVCGKAIETSEGKVVLSEVMRGRASYDNEIQYTPNKQRSVVTLSANSVIPIGGHFIMWDKDE